MTCVRASRATTTLVSQPPHSPGKMAFILKWEHVCLQVPMVEGNQDEDLAVIASGLAKANLTKVEQMVADLAQGEDKCTYQIIQNGSRQGRPLLVDSLGYTYTVKVLFFFWQGSDRNQTPVTLIGSSNHHTDGLVLTHWSYCSLALSYMYMYWYEIS